MASNEIYRQRLETRRDELTGRLGKINADLATPRSKDSEERATESENDEVLDELSRSGATELAAINAALNRINQDRFGICMDCGEPISPERLDILPFTAYCKTCAQERTGDLKAETALHRHH